MRRMWMLLLTVALMAVILAVPAMAAESHDEWTALDGSSTTISSDGNYYLSGDLNAAITVAAEGDVTICLCGHTWSAEGTRPLTISSGSVTLCDCEYAEPVVSDTWVVGDIVGGKIQGITMGTATSDYGGAVYIASGAGLTLESGTITGGTAYFGGNIYNLGTLTINGGAVRDGNADVLVGTSKGQGGNIYSVASGTKLVINGGIIDGGASWGNGGNIRVAVSFQMTGGKILNGYANADNGGNLNITGCNPSITGGTIANGMANNGGNMTVNVNSSRTLTLENVTIKDGKTGDPDGNGGITYTAGNGANVFVFNGSATVTIGSGTVISGGLSSAPTNGKDNLCIATNSTTSNGKTTQYWHTLTINEGAQIDGSIRVVSHCTVKLVGNVTINSTEHTNLYLESGAYCGVDASAMTGGSVGITMGTAGIFTENTCDHSTKASFFTSDDASCTVSCDSGSGMLWLQNGTETLDCACRGAGTDGACVQHTVDGETVGCSGVEDVVWQAWTSTSALPLVSGNYYLENDVTLTAQQAFAVDGRFVRLDLNGHTITNNSSKNIRFYAYAKTYNTVEITDSVGTGAIKNTSKYDQGGLFWLNANYSSLVVYAGVLDGREYSSQGKNDYGGNLIHMGNKGCTFYMYGGTVYGSSIDDPDTTEDEGFTREDAPDNTVGSTVVTARLPGWYGPVCMVSSGSINIYAGEIYGADLQCDRSVTYNSDNTVKGFRTPARGAMGGAILATEGNLNIYGGTIYGGNVMGNTYDHDCNTETDDIETAGKGGAIAILGSATAVIKNATITGGHADTEGGLIHNAGNLTMENCTVEDGTSRCSGLLYVTVDSVTTVTGGSFSNGTAYMSGGNMQVNGTTTLTNVTISGGTAGEHGGNINVWAGMLTLNNCTVTGGTATGKGDNIHINYYDGHTGEDLVTINGGTVDGGVYCSKNDTNEMPLALAGNVNISSWGKDTESGIYLASGAKLNVAELGNDAYVLIYADGGVSGTVLSNAKYALSADNFGLYNEGLYLAVNEGNELVLTDAAPEGATVVHNGRVLTAWPATVAEGDLVKLLADADGKTVAVDAYVDLNGYALTNLTATGTIKLFDSSASDYSTPGGKVTGVGISSFVTDFLTGDISNRNLRYITVEESDGSITAHRIYLAVKSTVLFPGVTPYIGYRTVLRCDDTIAGLINADGGEYGILLNSTYTDYNTEAGAYVTDSTDNSTRVKLDNLLGDDETKYEERSTATVSANAYIKIGGSTYTSASSTAHSLKSLTEAIVALDQSTISDSAKTALGLMYDTYSSFMAAWTGVANVLDGYYTAE